VGLTDFSPDGRKIAALSHDWKIAVWDIASGHLDAVLDAPRGYTTQDAGLTFSGDGRRIAACAGREAKLWDLGSGKTLRAWPLPPGLMDQLAFGSSERLVAFRCETLNSLSVPIGNDFRRYPRVCRIRNLLGPDPLRPLVEFRGFNRRIHGAVTAPDGRAFIVAGSHDGPDGRYRAIQALDGMTGEELWSMLCGTFDEQHENLVIQRAGENVVASSWDGSTERVILLSCSTGKKLRLLDHRPGSPSPDWKYFVREVPERHGVSLHDGDERQLLTLGIDWILGDWSVRPFSSDGKRLAWGNADGGVMIADLEEIGARLGRVGLSW
jgi:WD40 repeat protein